MRTLAVRRRLSPAEATTLVGSRVPASEPTAGLDALPVAVVDADTGEMILAVGPLPPALAGPLHAEFPGLPMQETLRANIGYRNASRVFGWAPRKPMFKHESCRPTPFMIEQPGAAMAVMDVADFCGAWMGEHLPVVLEHDQATLAGIKADWRLTTGPGALWTAGVINRTSPMPYHRDGNNFPTWSAMAVARRNVAEGHLHFPEHDVTVPCHDSTVIYWWGQHYVHGVTPMRARPRVTAYRFTVVYYALKGMDDCATFALESAAGRARRAKR